MRGSKGGNVPLMAYLLRLSQVAFLLMGSLVTTSALFRSSQEREAWLEKTHIEERDHIYRSLQEGERTVDIIVHYHKECAHHYYYNYTSGQPMTVDIDVYDEMFANKDKLCIVLIELDPDVEEESFVTGASGMDTSGFDLKNSEFEPWGLQIVLGDNFPPQHPNEFFESHPKVPICVIDSGIQADHPDLPYSGKDDPDIDGMEFGVGPNDRWYTTRNGHGMHVTGIICALSGNNQGTMGVIPDCKKYTKLYIARVFNNTGEPATKMSNVDSALAWCGQMGAKVITLSLSTKKPTFNTLEIIDQLAPTTLILAAAGNGGSNAGYAYPASFSGVMSVGSVGPGLVLSDFSQKGANLLAPGEDVLAPSVAKAVENEHEQGFKAEVVIFSAETDVDSVDGPICDAGCASSTFSCDNAICLIDRCTGISVTAQQQNAQLSGCKGTVISAASPQELYSDGPDFYFQSSISSVSINPIEATALRSSVDEGDDVVINFAHPNYKFADGTSQATPYVAGIATLLMYEFPDCSVEEIQQAMETGATQVMPDGGSIDFYGNGVVNGAAASAELKKLPCGGLTNSPTMSPTPEPTTSPTAKPTPEPTPEQGFSGGGGQGSTLEESVGSTLATPGFEIRTFEEAETVDNTVDETTTTIEETTTAATTAFDVLSNIPQKRGSYTSLFSRVRAYSRNGARGGRGSRGNNRQ